MVPLFCHIMTLRWLTLPSSIVKLPNSNSFAPCPKWTSQYLGCFLFSTLSDSNVDNEGCIWVTVLKCSLATSIYLWNKVSACLCTIDTISIWNFTVYVHLMMLFMTDITWTTATLSKLKVHIWLKTLLPKFSIEISLPDKILRASSTNSLTEACTILLETISF